jgi:DNA-binding winged helix-turn-helix (wHTH) protein
MIRFGVFELDTQSGQLLKNGRVVRIKPQPFKLLQLLASRPGQVVSREEIRQLLWEAGTFVDFEQGVNTAIKQIRDALNEDAERPLYLQTIPKRGYRFIAPVEGAGPAVLPGIMPPVPQTDLGLQKVLWLNIVELRMEEARRRRRRQVLVAVAVATAVVALGTFLTYLR